MSFDFNTDLLIWTNYFILHPEHNMTFLDGHVYMPGGECLARFADNKAAMAIIEQARRAATEKYPEAVVS